MSSYTHFVVCQAATGRILRHGTCRANAVSYQAMAPGEVSMASGSAVSDLYEWVNIPAGNLIEQRPGLVDMPTTKTLAVDEDWPIPGVPDGTEVWIDGVLAGTTDATGLTLSFPLATVWKLRLVPPFPWMPADCEVTVT